MQSHAYEKYVACGKAAAANECKDNKGHSKDNKNNTLYNNRVVCQIAQPLLMIPIAWGEKPPFQLCEVLQCCGFMTAFICGVSGYEQNIEKL